MHLRPYQSELINLWIQALKNNHKRVLIYAPTGAGKTVIASDMIANLNRRRDWHCLFVVRQETLVSQTISKLNKLGIEPGVIKAGYEPDLSHPIQVASIQTMNSRGIYPPANLVILDEAHGAFSDQYDPIYEHYSDALIVGFTATPFRRKKSESLEKRFEKIIGKVQTIDLVRQGYLVDPILHVPNTSMVDVDGIGESGGDYKNSELAAACNRPEIIQDAFNYYQKIAKGKRAIAFSVNTDHSMAIAEIFNNNDVPTEVITANTKSDKRQAMYARLKSLETLVLVSVNVLSEGFDEPSVEVMIGLRPTLSKGLWIQQVGRVLRLSPETSKSKAFILDHACNCHRFGHPLDQINLNFQEVNKKIDSTDLPNSKTCGNCGHENRISAIYCEACGYCLVDRREVDLINSGVVTPEDLVKIRLKQWRHKQKTNSYAKTWIFYRFIEEYPKASLDQLKELAKVMGYKWQWALYKHKEIHGTVPQKYQKQFAGMTK